MKLYSPHQSHCNPVCRTRRVSYGSAFAYRRYPNLDGAGVGFAQRVSIKIRGLLPDNPPSFAIENAAPQAEHRQGQLPLRLAGGRNDKLSRPAEQAFPGRGRSPKRPASKSCRRPPWRTAQSCGRTRSCCSRQRWPLCGLPNRKPPTHEHVLPANAFGSDPAPTHHVTEVPDLVSRHSRKRAHSARSGSVSTMETGSPSASKGIRAPSIQSM